MLKKLVFVLSALILTMGLANANADVNKADQAVLDGVRGIGPAMSKRILDERKKGEFRDWPDLEARVKGIGGKSATKLSDAGLTVNGQARGNPAVTAKPAAKAVAPAKGGASAKAADTSAPAVKN